MSGTATTLQLGMFSARFSKSSLDLPVASFSTWDESTGFLKSLEKGVDAHREESEVDKTVHIYLLNGNGDLPRNSVSLTATRYLWQGLILGGLRSYFSKRNYRVHKDKFGVEILEPVPALQTGLAVVRRGIFIQAKRPFVDSPDLYVISASWITPAHFVAGLEDETLRSMALGNGVIFTPGPEERVARELVRYRYKHLGTVKEIRGDNDVVVYCADHSLRLLPADQLQLEAKPATLAEYDRRIGARGKPLWSELLKLNFTLSANGRRNNAVLRDRLSAIRRLLANGNSRVLLLSPTTFDDITVEIALNPIAVQVAADV